MINILPLCFQFVGTLSASAVGITEIIILWTIHKFTLF